MRILILAWIIVIALFGSGVAYLQLSHGSDHGKENAHDTDGAKSRSDDATPMVANTDEAPAKASKISPPLPELQEEGPYGPLPIIYDRKQPWIVYAHPSKNSARPKIALMVMGAGLNKKMTKRVVDMMPSPVAIAFSPYSADIEEQLARTRQMGHEYYMMIPMEPSDYPVNDPGPHTMLVNLTPAENLDRFYQVLSRFQGYAGIVNDMGAKFTANEFAMTPIFKDIQRRGLIFVDSRQSRFSTAGTVARNLGVPHAPSNRYIDDNVNPAAIDRELEALEQIAKQGGSVLALVRPYPVSIDRVQLWAKKLNARGIDLVPVSTIAALGQN